MTYVTRCDDVITKVTAELCAGYGVSTYLGGFQHLVLVLDTVSHHQVRVKPQRTVYTDLGKQTFGLTMN